MSFGNTEKIGLDGRPIREVEVPPVEAKSVVAEPVAAEPVATETRSKSKTSIELNMGSHHFCDPHDPKNRVWSGDRQHGYTSRPYNQQNWGVGVSHMREIWQSASGNVTASVGGSLGQYRNSLYRNSVYATANAEVDYKATQSVNVGVGVQVGAVTGYDKHVVPAGQVYAKIEHEFPREMAGVRSVFAQFGVIPGAKSGNLHTPPVGTMKVGISF